MYELKNGRIELVYIGSSGKVQNDGKIKHRIGGLWDRIVNGHQFGKTPRKISWKNKLIDENIDALDIYWYDTFNSENRDIPIFVEATIIQRYFEIHGHLPRWNKEKKKHNKKTYFTNRKRFKNNKKAASKRSRFKKRY